MSYRRPEPPLIGGSGRRPADQCADEPDERQAAGQGDRLGRARVCGHPVVEKIRKPVAEGGQIAPRVRTLLVPGMGARIVQHMTAQLQPGLMNVRCHLRMELQAAVVSAALAIFIKMDADAFQTLFDGQSADTYIQGASGWDGSINTDLDGPGKAVNLLPGESVDVPSLGRPNANYDPFFLSMLKQIGPVLEIPFEVLIKHFSSSYSASRAALLDFWRFVRVRRDFMATYFCEPIKDLWFEEAIASGRISAPGFFQIQDSGRPGRA